MKPAAALLVALAILASPGAGATAPPGESPRAVVLHVEIEKEGVELNHSFDEQSVFLAGSVVVDFVYLVTVRVALSASTDLGWGASVAPGELTFVTSTPQFFNATVKVPAGTANRTALLTVRGNATVTPGVPGDTASDTATVAVMGGGGGNGNGTPPVAPRGRPAPTGVFVPPAPLIIVAATAGAAVFSAYMLWYWKTGPARRPEKKMKGRR